MGPARDALGADLPQRRRADRRGREKDRKIDDRNMNNLSTFT
jgi:hypothetical protein